jgi:hypothetical protein
MPAARSTRTRNVHERQPVAWQRASPFFCKQVLQRRVVEHGICQQLLQLGVLALEPPETLGFRELKSAVLGLPVVEASLNPVITPDQFKGATSGSGAPRLAATSYLFWTLVKCALEEPWLTTLACQCRKGVPSPRTSVPQSRNSVC